jgi:multicomponent Na+:H+ antiporter subunit C
VIEYLESRGPYLLYAFLMLLGFFILLTRRNLLSSLIGLYLVQSSIIVFFILLSVRSEATIPIRHGEAPLHNPLPHALMLTAIVVGVATLGVGMAILRRYHQESGTIEDRGPPGDGA